MTTTAPLSIKRADIWWIRFDPTEGDEIRKTRPAVVMNIAAAWRLHLYLVVPITEWKPFYDREFWMINITPSKLNGLTKESAANAFQVKSVSEKRFESKLGVLTPVQMNDIAAAIVVCVGYDPLA